jgi:hypothetical protein
MHPEVIKRLRDVATNPAAASTVRERARQAADALEWQLEEEQGRLAATCNGRAVEGPGAARPAGGRNRARAEY